MAAIKQLAGEMETGYNPANVEKDWYSWWEQSGFFKPRSDREEVPADAKKFVIVLPPPNVTGYLHLGHALTSAVQDTLIRYNRMLGHDTLYLPGTDHAGIATQVVVEKRLKASTGKSRHDFGREDFVKQVWSWKEDHAGAIQKQLRRCGASLDWSRERFTMDDQCAAAVLEAFVKLHEDGLIYRATRLVNWCCALQSAISDVEVDTIEVEKNAKLAVPGYEKKVDMGQLTHIAYKVVGSDEELVIATTRPETLIGDTAVAIHPEDPRFKHLHGKQLQCPFRDETIPIILDAKLVDMEFGTGAVKVTPAHDPNDFACGRRNGLPEITVFTEDGLINENGGEFRGQKRFDCRYNIIKALEDKGLFRGKEDNAMRLGICSRSSDIIEPLLKPQWWVKSEVMAARACQAVRDGELKIEPEAHEATWFRWLENIKDWCVSRQLWWGHRIPAYQARKAGADKPSMENPNAWVVGRTEEEARKNAAVKLGVAESEVVLEQDEDVLDTWFSSGLFPFSSFGWPDENSADFKAFYPTTLLETGHDILFFWVARMVMMGLTLTDKLPFKTVYLHAMVRDAHGRKMSKSLGNVIDPLEVINGITLEELQEKLKAGNLDPREVEKAVQGQKADFPNGIPECGADALRFGLLAYTVQGRNVNLDINRVVGYRQFCNKLWNATKFALSHFGSNYKPGAGIRGVPSMVDQWILSRLNACTVAMNKCMQDYEFGVATQAIYAFWLYEFCDVYLEAIKPVMAVEGPAKVTTQDVLYTCLDRGLRLLHPMMCFVTEELYQRLPENGNKFESISIAYYPEPVPAWNKPLVEAQMKTLLEVVHHSRSLQTSLNIAAQTQRPKMYVRSKAADVVELINTHGRVAQTLAKTDEVFGILFPEAAPEGCAVDVVNDSLEVFLMVRGLIDVAAETAKLSKKKTVAQTALEQLKKKMTIPDYENKVPANIQEKNSQQLAALEAEIAAIDSAVAGLAAFN
eukprot:GILI01002816.1.p1 GENE.GILI01002816.1~~GILI01002816.1.p1  ORF type:complete len:973 (-),score=377.56 GILI01002816.1:248-3166(-)